MRARSRHCGSRDIARSASVFFPPRRKKPVQNLFFPGRFFPFFPWFFPPTGKNLRTLRLFCYGSSITINFSAPYLVLSIYGASHLLIFFNLNLVPFYPVLNISHYLLSCHPTFPRHHSIAKTSVCTPRISARGRSCYICLFIHCPVLTWCPSTAIESWSWTEWRASMSRGSWAMINSYSNTNSCQNKSTSPMDIFPMCMFETLQ